VNNSNGDLRNVLKIGRKGLLPCQLDEGPVFKIDVIAWCADWSEIDRGFRDEHGQVPPERLLEHQRAILDFVRFTFKQGGYADDDVRSLTCAEALEFMHAVGEKGQELRRFFEPDSATEPSSPAGSGTFDFSG